MYIFTWKRLSLQTCSETHLCTCVNFVLILMWIWQTLMSSDSSFHASEISPKVISEKQGKNTGWREYKALRLPMLSCFHPIVPQPLTSDPRTDFSLLSPELTQTVCLLSITSPMYFKIFEWINLINTKSSQYKLSIWSGRVMWVVYLLYRL